MNKNGVTLIELAITLGIVAIAFYALINVFAIVIPKNINATALITGTHLLNSKMEESIMCGFVGSVGQREGDGVFDSPLDNYRYYVKFSYLPNDQFSEVIVKVWGPKLNTVEAYSIYDSKGKI